MQQLNDKTSHKSSGVSVLRVSTDTWIYKDRIIVIDIPKIYLGKINKRGE